MGEFKIISDLEDDLERNDSIKESFLRRDFVNTKILLENAVGDETHYDNDAIQVNKALVYHILGQYEEASQLYKKNMENSLAYLNYMACCHRYFDYEKLCEIQYGNPDNFEMIYKNNYFNYLVGTKGVNEAGVLDTENSVFTEQILNDIYTKIGKAPLHNQNDILKKQYIKTTEVVKRKKVNNNKKKVGIFVTDIQRHKNAAIIFELVEVLQDKFEIYIYFNNIFANKLAKKFEDNCIVRYVINLYFEEVNNLFYEDGIDILIDLAGYGLRNNNLAISLVSNVINLDELLSEFPLLLKTMRYFPDIVKPEVKNVSCVIGDLRCLSDEELIKINKSYEGKLIFESHSLDESVFKNFFSKWLKRLGYDMDRVELMEGVLPFSRYMEFLSGCKNVIISSGASYIELAEAIRSQANIIMLSKNKNVLLEYELYSKMYNQQKIEYQNVKSKLIEYIFDLPAQELVKVKNKKSRIAYIEDDRKFSISNTCNGDVVILDEGRK